MKPKVSIIVPIYNAEKYLARCLDSLLAQHLQDIEIIAVNDGSTDQSLEMLREYASKDQRIIVINQSNGGVSSARNKGLQHAGGDYIGFVDPDDWVDAQMYQDMYQTAREEKADIVMCTYMREFETHSKEKIFHFPKKVRFDDSEVHSKVMRRLVGPLDEEIAYPEYLDAWGTVWSKLYRADMLKDHQVYFTDLSIVGTNEDSLFNIHAIYYAKTFIFLNQPYYHYWRANSASLTAGYKPNLIHQWFHLYQLMESFIKEKELSKEFYQALQNRICLNTLGLGLNTISKANRSSIPAKLSKLHTILNDERIKRSFRQFEMKYFSMVWRAFYFCAKSRFVLGFYSLLMTMEWLRKMIR